MKALNDLSFVFLLLIKDYVVVYTIQEEKILILVVRGNTGRQFAGAFWTEPA